MSCRGCGVDGRVLDDGLCPACIAHNEHMLNLTGARVWEPTWTARPSETAERVHVIDVPNHGNVAPPSRLVPPDVDPPSFFVAGWVVHRPHELLLIRVDNEGNLYVDDKPITAAGRPAGTWAPVEVTGPIERRTV